MVIAFGSNLGPILFG